MKYLPTFKQTHWLAWWKTIGLVLFFYGGYTFLSGATVGYAQRAERLHESMQSSWIYLWALLGFFVITIAIVYFWQRNQKVQTFNFKQWAILFLIGIFFMWASGVISNLIFAPYVNLKTATGSNQVEIINHFFAKGSIQLWTILSTAFIAPFFEEFTFRYLLIGPKTIDGKHKFTTPKRLRIIWIAISLTIFVYMHIMDDFNQLIMHMDTGLPAWLSIAREISIYGIMGGALTYVYVKSNNIWYSLSVHIAWNVYTMLPLLLLLLAR